MQHCGCSTRDIQRLSTFKRDIAKLVSQLRKTGQPVVLTVNGKAELVVQDAESYQKLFEAKTGWTLFKVSNVDSKAWKRNAGKPAEKFFQELFTEKGLAERE